MTVCMVDECGRAIGTGGAKSKAQCAMHYMRAYRNKGTPALKGRYGRERATTQKATVSPTIADLAWAAGFIEGEGTFSRTGSKNKAGVQGSTNVVVPQKDPQPLERLLRLFGGNIRIRDGSGSLGGNDIWVWVVSGSRARGVAMTLYSWFSDRRKQQVRVALGVA